jgi:hypothetical protein
MWELPLATLPTKGSSGRKVDFLLRHAITTTEYRVSVFRLAEANLSLPGGRWVRSGAAAMLPLTGLARKVLRRAGLI